MEVGGGFLLYISVCKDITFQRQVSIRHGTRSGNGAVRPGFN